MADTRSVSMADRYELDECVLVGGEEGVCGQELSDPLLPGTGGGSEPDYDAITETDSVLLEDPFLLLGQLQLRCSRTESLSMESRN